MREVPLCHNHAVFVDDDDYKEVLKYSWYILKSPTGDSVVRSVKTMNGMTLQRLSQFVLGVAPGEAMGRQIDHKNGNIFDNRKENLRFCNHSQNQMNSKKHVGTSSKYKGVHYFKRARRWQAYIMKDYKRKHLGYFSDETVAAKAYDNAAKELFGDFARLNFPVEVFHA